MKSSAKAGKFAPRVTKLDKNKYAAYVDIHIGALWEMVVNRSGVCICKKRKEAVKVADRLAAAALHADHLQSKKHGKSPARH